MSQLEPDDQAYKVTDIGYEVVNRYSHDPEAFTEGLAFLNGYLYESAGSTDTVLSTLRQVAISTGKVLKRYELPAKYFAEGITILQKRIFQLTLSGRGFVYDLESFRLLDTFRFKDDGWGLTNDGQYLIMSNGSNRLQRINPNTFEVVGNPIGVFVNGKPLDKLNELEYINGYLYANVWMTDFVYRISPQNGAVLGRIDLSGLRPPKTKECEECVLNGIAPTEKSDHLYVTGKMWPTMFEIRLLQ